jgi:glycosyltransferase involved in cell wall biosynthesis
MLEQATPDVVAVNGWNNFGSLVAANCCMDRGIPMVVMSESARQDEARTWWKEIIKRRIVDFYSAALVGGQRHVEYLVELGMPRERIFTGYDVVDNDYFAQRAIEIRDSHLRRSSLRSRFGGVGGYGGQAAFEIRKEYGLPEDYFLASARFIEKKNLPSLIRAYAEYREKWKGDTPWDLVLLGDGPLRETLNAQLSTLNLHSHVHFPGFKQYDELPVYYALANAFVHASTTEQWGLVVNEAIASGLPVIVSDRCGCAPELVQDNGFAFNPMDEHELASLLFKMAKLSDDERKRLGDASYRIAAKFSPERFGEGLECSARVAMELAARRFGVIDRALLFAASKYGQ